MDISMQAYYIPSSQPDERLHVIIWSPENPKATVQIVHGMCEHIGRYDEFARRLCEHGYAVIGNSHLGHGLTARSPDDLGHIKEKYGWERMVEDLGRVRDFAGQKLTFLPHMMFGHSMGSFLLRDYLTRELSEGIKAAVICGTGDTPMPVVTAGLRSAEAIKGIRGDHYRSKRLASLTFSGYNDSFKPIRTEFDWLSGNQESVDKYIADPLCGFRFTTSAYCALAYGLGRIYKMSNIRQMKRYNKDLPCLFIAGALDPVGDKGKGVKRVVKKFKRAGIDAEIKLYENDRHEIFNEADREQVYADVIAFYDKAL